MEIKKAKIGNALTSSAANHVVAVSEDIYSESLGRYQSDVNNDIEKSIRRPAVFGEIITKDALVFNEGFYLQAYSLKDTVQIIEYTHTSYTLGYSDPIEVKRGDIIVITTIGSGMATLCKTDAKETFYTPLILGTDGTTFQTSKYIVEEDGYVTFCSRLVDGYNFTIYRGASVNGYKVVENDKTLQSQLDAPDTIYEIRYGFAGEKIELPANSVLKFTGGTLSNCTIVGNNVTIEAPLVQIFGDNVTFRGDFNCDFYPEWFGATSVIDENVDNSEAFKRAIKAINSMNGAHNLMLTTHYVLKDTIYLYPKVSLIGTYGTDDYITNTPKNEAIGCGFIANFSNNDKYVIDSDFAKDYNIGCTDMWIDYENIKTDGNTFKHRKQTNIRDIAIQPYRKTDSTTGEITYNVPFGGIRLIDAYYGYIENVHISGVAVGISLHKSWEYHISKVYLTVCFCGFYFGMHNTIQYLSSCKIYGTTDFKWVSNDGTIDTTADRFCDKFNWRPKAEDEDNRCDRATIFPPYDINGNRPAFSDNTEDFGYYPADEKYSNEPIDLKLIGFISEGYIHSDINKIKFQSIIFHWLNCIGLDNSGEIDLDFCYVESKSDTPELQFKTGLYTYKGTITWNNPARTEKIRPYGLATMWGKIKSDRMTDGTCFPYRQAAKFTNADGVKTNEKYIHDAPSYILAETAQYLDKYDIIEDKTTVEGKTIRATNSGVGANKQYIGQQTFYVGYVDYKVTDFDYYYQDVASGLVYHAPTSFKNILERYDPDNAVFVQSCFNTDFSAGGKLLINKNFKFRRGTSSRIATSNKFPLLQPMRLHDSYIEIGYDEDASLSLESNLSNLSVDGIPVANRIIPPVFAVSGKCTIKINSWFNYTNAPKGFIKIVDDDKDYSNSPIEVHLICPKLYESDLSHESIIGNTESIATKYRITVTNNKETVILTNITPPTKGVAVGETFEYVSSDGQNRTVLTWDGTKWNANRKWELAGAVFNSTGKDVTHKAPWDIVNDVTEYVTHKDGYWYLNGIGDLTDDEMENIDAVGAVYGNPISRYELTNIRTNMPAFSSDASNSTARFGYTGNFSRFLYGSKIKVFRLFNTKSLEIILSNTAEMFNSSDITHFIDIINVGGITNFAWAFGGAKNLVTIKLKGVKADVDLGSSPNLSKESILYLINNADKTATINLRLHEVVRNKCEGSGEWAAEVNKALSDSGSKINFS